MANARVVPSPEASPWSSAAAHCGLTPPPSFLDTSWWRQTWTPSRWRDVLIYGRDERIEAALRESTRRGFPFGSPTFLEQHRQQTGRALFVRPPGRPRTH